MKRKSIKLAWLTHKVNKMNRLSTCDAQVREGWNALLESCLHEASVYSGFHYLGKADVPNGCLPGIDMSYPPDATPSNEERYPDESRRNYYFDKTLHADLEAMPEEKD